MHPAITEPDAGLVVLSFQGTKVLPFPEMDLFPGIKQDIFCRLPYMCCDFLGSQTVNISNIPFLLELYEFMQRIFAESILVSDIAQFFLNRLGLPILMIAVHGIPIAWILAHGTEHFPDMSNYGIVDFPSGEETVCKDPLVFFGSVQL